MIDNLFTLLRLGLDTSTIEKENLSDFIMLPAEKWASLGDLARNQGVLGIILDGIDKLENTRYGLTRELQVNQKLEWIGEVLQIEQRNQHQKEVMNDLTEKWLQNNIRVMVMKGQANGLLYPKPNHRSPGDIDCYLFKDYALGNEIARHLGADVDESWYKHSVIRYEGETFENHQYFVHTREGKRSKLLQKELADALNADKWEYFPDSCICLPPAQWNAMFLTYHACAHFITEGLRLKQLLDWAMFLHKEQNDVDWEQFYAFCDRYHLRRFSDAITTICIKHLGVQITNSTIITKSSYANKVLDSALYDDDYIYGTGEGLWESRLHLVKSMFKYRWKYEDIYQQSVWKQLWWYFTGFMFHTENS